MLIADWINKERNTDTVWNNYPNSFLSDYSSVSPYGPIFPLRLNDCRRCHCRLESPGSRRLHIYYGYSDYGGRKPSKLVKYWSSLSYDMIPFFLSALLRLCRRPLVVKFFFGSSIESGACPVRHLPSSRHHFNHARAINEEASEGLLYVRKTSQENMSKLNFLLEIQRRPSIIKHDVTARGHSSAESATLAA